MSPAALDAAGVLSSVTDDRPSGMQAIAERLLAEEADCVLDRLVLGKEEIPVRRVLPVTFDPGTTLAAPPAYPG